MGVRYFNGAREQGRSSPASELFRFEFQKKGKLTPVERYKFLFQKKMEENRKLATMNKGKKIGFNLPGAKSNPRRLSARAENALKEIAQRKAAKQAKVMRQMVIVQPRQYHNGSVNRKGQIYDIAGNMVGKVNRKNGNIGFFGGFAGGKYKPKHLMTDLFIQESITKYSPYYINLRKMQAMQQGLVHGAPSTDDVINLYGHKQSTQPVMMTGIHGAHADGGGSNISAGVTSWGVMSNNAWGTYSDNAWGTVADNVWGTAETNVWGGIGGNSLWGWKGVKYWGTGNGTNYLRKLGNAIAALFGLRGFGNGKSRDGSSSSRFARMGGVGRSGARTSAPAPRSSGRAR